MKTIIYFIIVLLVACQSKQNETPVSSKEQVIAQRTNENPTSNQTDQAVSQQTGIIEFPKLRQNIEDLCYCEMNYSVWVEFHKYDSIMVELIDYIKDWKEKRDSLLKAGEERGICKGDGGGISIPNGREDEFEKLFGCSAESFVMNGQCYGNFNGAYSEVERLRQRFIAREGIQKDWKIPKDLLYYKLNWKY